MQPPKPFPAPTEKLDEFDYRNPDPMHWGISRDNWYAAQVTTWVLTFASASFIVIACSAQQPPACESKAYAAERVQLEKDYAKDLIAACSSNDEPEELERCSQFDAIFEKYDMKRKELIGRCTP